MKNKKQKLFTGILVPAASLAVVGSVAGVVIGLANTGKKASYLNEAKITYSAGEGRIVSGGTETHFEAGTTLDRIDQPVVRPYAKNKLFAGWADENNEMIYGSSKIGKDMKLHAVYNSIGDEYATVTFTNDPAITEATVPVLQGNLSVSVNKGYYFFMVNRPTAKWTVTDAKGITKEKYFKGWKKASDGQILAEDSKIENNITLYPEFTEAVTVTFDAVGFKDKGDQAPPAGDGYKVRGSDYTTLETGTKFDLFNQPAIEYKVTAASGKAYFAGWYFREGTAEPYTYTPVDPDKQITENVTVYAKWSREPEVGDRYGTLHFDSARPTDAYDADLPSGMTTSYTPTSDIVIEVNGRSWGTTNKPTVVCTNADGTINTNYKVDHWEIKTGNTWTEISDAYKFTAKSNTVRPVLTYAIERLYIYGDNTLSVEVTNQQYGVVVIGGASSSKSGVTWSLVTDNSGSDTPFPQALAKIDEYGRITIGSLTRELYESYGYDHFYIKAVSKLDTTKHDYFRVELTMPYVNNTYIWIHTEQSSSSNPKWYYANIDDFCTGTREDLITHSVSDNSQKVFLASEDFIDTITFGSDLGAIPDNFLKGWTNFKGNIDFKNSNIITIGENFMSGCESFNKELDLNKIVVIKANFLKGCIAYNQPITFSDTSLLSFIGASFLHGCTAFNSKITLPGYTELEIDNNFLQSCTSFNQDIELPNTVKYVGSYFMNDCKAFTSKLIVNTPVENIIYNLGTLSSPDINAAIYQIGFDVGGTQATNFRLVWKTLKEENYYRTIVEDKFEGKVDEKVFKQQFINLWTTGNYTASNSQGTLKVINTVANANGQSSNAITDPWTLCECDLGGAGSDVLYMKRASYTKTDPLYDLLLAYKGDGSFYDGMGAKTKEATNPDYIKTCIQYCLINQDPYFSDYPDYNYGAWGFDEANKAYYAYNNFGSQYCKLWVKFDSSQTINYVAAQMFDYETGDWGPIGFYANISNIGTTKISKAPTTYESVVNSTFISDFKRDSKHYLSTSLPAIEAGTSKTIVFKLQKDQWDGLMPAKLDAFLYSSTPDAPISITRDMINVRVVKYLENDDEHEATQTANYNVDSTNKIVEFSPNDGSDNFTAESYIIFSITAPDAGLPAGLKLYVKEHKSESTGLYTYGKITNLPENTWSTGHFAGAYNTEGGYYQEEFESGTAKILAKPEVGDKFTMYTYVSAGNTRFIDRITGINTTKSKIHYLDSTGTQHDVSFSDATTDPIGLSIGAKIDSGEGQNRGWPISFNKTFIDGISDLRIDVELNINTEYKAKFIAPYYYDNSGTKVNIENAKLYDSDPTPESASPTIYAWDNEIDLDITKNEFYLELPLDAGATYAFTPNNDNSSFKIYEGEREYGYDGEWYFSSLIDMGYITYEKLNKPSITDKQYFKLTLKSGMNQWLYNDKTFDFNFEFSKAQTQFTTKFKLDKVNIDNDGAKITDVKGDVITTGAETSITKPVKDGFVFYVEGSVPAEETTVTDRYIDFYGSYILTDQGQYIYLGELVNDYAWVEYEQVSVPGARDYKFKFYIKQSPLESQSAIFNKNSVFQIQICKSSSN